MAEIKRALKRKAVEVEVAVDEKQKKKKLESDEIDEHMLRVPCDLLGDRTRSEALEEIAREQEDGEDEDYDSLTVRTGDGDARSLLEGESPFCDGVCAKCELYREMHEDHPFCIKCWEKSTGFYCDFCCQFLDKDATECPGSEAVRRIMDLYERDAAMN